MSKAVDFVKTIDFKYRPNEGQIKIHQACSYASPYTWINLCCSRRSGKSTAIIVDGLLKALKLNKDKQGREIPRRIWYVLPKADQGTNLYWQLINYIKNINVVYKRTASKGGQSIIFKNGSEIHIKSAGSGTSLLGAGLDVLYIDEIADVSETTIQQVLLPMLSNCKQPKIIFSGTPRSKSHWWYKWFLTGREKENKDVITIHFTYRDNPLANLKYIAQQEKLLPKKVYLNEYEAEWTDGSSIFEYTNCINNDVLLRKGIEGEKYYGALDYSLGAEGKKSDYTVLTICNSKGQVVFIDRWRQLKLPVVKQRIAQAYFNFNLRKLTLEKAGMNALFQVLKYDMKLANIDEWVATNDSKEKAIHQLQGAFEEGAITIPNVGFGEVLCLELDSYYATPTKSGTKLSYQGFPNDDCVSSLYILWQCFLKNRRKGSYTVMSS